MKPLLLASLVTSALWAQGNPLSTELKRDYRGVRDFFVRAAEKMPEADYVFRPSADMRSFGQQVAHVADDQYNLCAPAKGETRKAAYTAIEDTLSHKAELVAALKEAFAYCDVAYDGLTDASASEMVKSGQTRSRFSMLNWNCGTPGNTTGMSWYIIYACGVWSRRPVRKECRDIRQR